MPLDKNFKQLLTDRFDPAELVELLDVTTEDVVDVFESEIEAAYEDLSEIMELMNDDDEDSDYPF